MKSFRKMYYFCSLALSLSTLLTSAAFAEDTKTGQKEKVDRLEEASPYFLDTFRSPNGYPDFVTQDRAIASCRLQYAALPNVHQWILYAMEHGAIGLVTKCDDSDFHCSNWMVYNLDGTWESLHYSSARYKPAKDPLRNNPSWRNPNVFWTSSSVYRYPGSTRIEGFVGDLVFNADDGTFTLPIAVGKTDYGREYSYQRARCVLVQK